LREPPGPPCLCMRAAPWKILMYLKNKEKAPARTSRGFYGSLGFA